MQRSIGAKMCQWFQGAGTLEEEGQSGREAKGQREFGFHVARNGGVARGRNACNTLGAPWRQSFCCALVRSAQRARCARLGGSLALPGVECLGSKGNARVRGILVKRRKRATMVWMLQGGQCNQVE